LCGRYTVGMTSNTNDRVFKKIKESADKARRAREGIEQAQRDFKAQREKAKEEAKKKRAK
jgi:F0F1-type ATP synthase membrane subunit b/b'